MGIVPWIRFAGFSGVASSSARAEFERRNKDAFRKQIERWLNGTLPALRDTKVEATDRFPAPEFQLSVSFLSYGYGRLMRDELLVFKPALVARRDAARLTRKPRTLPVVLRRVAGPAPVEKAPARPAGSQ